MSDQGNIMWCLIPILCTRTFSKDCSPWTSITRTSVQNSSRSVKTPANSGFCFFMFASKAQSLFLVGEVWAEPLVYVVSQSPGLGRGQGPLKQSEVSASSVTFMWLTSLMLSVPPPLEKGDICHSLGQKTNMGRKFACLAREASG